MASADILLQLVRTYGTPTYVYDASMIQQRCDRLKAAFQGLPVSWMFAVKANDNPHILKLIKYKGFGFDTVSFEEVLLALKVGQHPEHIFYTENNMTDMEMVEAIESKVVLNIGSFSRLEHFCSSKGAKTCTIRVNPRIGDGHHSKVDTGNQDSKFGIRLDLIPDALRVASEHGVKLTGLHIHIGSGIQRPENLTQAMKVLIDIGRQLPDLQYINFGGGFPVPYQPGDQEFSIEEFANAATPILKAEYERRQGHIRFLFEPGRWIVAPAGVLLTQVNTVKDQGRITFLGTDTGFNHLIRPAMYEAYHHVVNVSKVDQPTVKKYTIAGNICESGDILAEDRILPDTEIGDILALCDAGAYGMTMASSYNRRALPAEIMLDRDGSHRVIRPRKSPRRVVDEFIEETMF